MLQSLYEFCSSYRGLVWFSLASDLAIASAYFAIPVTMGVVLRHRREDIPYPWLWALFVTFIVACGLTHVVHLLSAFTGVEYLSAQVLIGVVTAVASVGTAIAFAFVLPEIRNLPSPRQQQALLEKMVRVRTAEKDRLIREINHRVGNQLQVMTSLVRIEQRGADQEETVAALDRIAAVVQQMSERHHSHSSADYLSLQLADDPMPAG